MTRISSEATIRRSADEVFDYVTTPANWPQWHPSSIRVTGDAGHSQDVGERCTEEFVVAGQHGVCEWVVLRRDAPSSWVIEARPEAGGRATITYALTPDGGGGTRFTRTLEYEMPNALLAVLDALVIRRRIERESAQAVANLRAVLEAAPASAAG
ncbi:MAG: SRPBCC family protein [Candidatus Eremiobacteraeota bacterium]|nr:SRPBCC family protein [Candidatus Eremiobacteraeota bacterium]